MTLGFKKRSSGSLIASAPSEMTPNHVLQATPNGGASLAVAGA